jgi:hypothetical protein
MEKRSYPRKDFVGRVKVKFESDDGEVKQVFGLVEDRSPAGMLINVKAFIKPGSAITVVASFGTFEGEVVRCVRAEGGGHQVGIRLPEI